MTVSTLSATPETVTVLGAAPSAEPDLTLRLDGLSRSTDIRLQAVARAARPDYDAWLSHVRSAAACTGPVRLAGTIATIEAATGRLLAERATADMPDGVIYKPCRNRRESVCPSCSRLYQRDAYHVVRAGLVGGKGGNPFTDRTWSGEWVRWSRAAGWPEDPTHSGFHALRRYCATKLITEHVDPKDVQRALRHASLSITLETYVHFWPRAERRRGIVGEALRPVAAGRW